MSREYIADRSMPEPNSGCWLWLLSVDHKGYGKIGGGGHGTMSAHRVSWSVHHGEVPGGLHVLHKCDVPSCVNPSHLFLGTGIDNINDKVAKGRQARGERMGPAKLIAAQVIAIRQSPESDEVVAGRFGVSARNIYFIRNRLSWRHI